MKSKIPNLTPEQIAHLLGDPVEPSKTGVENLSNNPVFFPGRVISLWEMNQLLTEKFLNSWIGFQNEFLKAAQNKARPTSLLQVGDRKNLIRVLEAMDWQCDLLGFVNSRKCCQQLLKQITDPSWHWDAPRWEALTQGKPQPPIPKEIPLQTFQQIYAQMRLMHDFLREEMESVKMVVIKHEKVRFFEQNALFGPAVKTAASAELNAEIRAAGNCLAADLNTASVFHLMRIVEHGMRSLAPQLNVKMSKHQISQATWSKLIAVMDDEIRQTQKPQSKPGQKPLKSGQKKFYRGLLLSINSFKDLWRNDVMHTRGNYTAVDAEAVFGHVKAFIELLASNGVPLK